MKGNNLNELKVVLKGYDVWRWAWVGSLTLSVCVWWKVVALLLFGPHGCIQTPLDQQLFMSDGKMNKTEKHQIRLGSIFMPSCSVFFNHTDTNAPFALSRTGHFDPVCNYCQQNVEGPWNTQQFPFQSFTYRSIPEQVISIQFHVKVPELSLCTVLNSYPDHILKLNVRKLATGYNNYGRKNASRLQQAAACSHYLIHYNMTF